MNDEINPLQLILVVETSSQDKTDSIYINEVVKKYFDISDVNVHWITLGGKQHYKDKKVKDRINNLTRMFKSNAKGNTVTIFFVDTDSTEKEYTVGSFFSNLVRFVEENGYELVWFCKNSENVFLQVEPDMLENKTEAAIKFSVSNGVDNIPQNNLSKNTIELNCSNILVILSKYLKYKNSASQ